MSLVDKVFSHLFGCMLKPVWNCNAALKNDGFGKYTKKSNKAKHADWIDTDFQSAVSLRIMASTLLVHVYPTLFSSSKANTLLQNLKY